MKVYDVSGNITAELTWYRKGIKWGMLGFEGLFNIPGEVGVENDFHGKCINDKVNIERDMENEYLFQIHNLIFQYQWMKLNHL